MSKEPNLNDWKRGMAFMVRYRLRANNMTVEDLSHKSGLSTENIKKVLDEKLYPSHKMRQMLAKPLGCSLEFVKPRVEG